MKKRVVITGRGAVTPFGLGVPAFAAALRAGQSGIRLLQQLDTSRLPTRGGGEVLEPLPDVANLTGLGLTPRFVHFALLAWQEAWQESGLMESVSQGGSFHTLDPERIGVLIGTSRGVVRELEMLQGLLKQKGHGALQEEHGDLLAALFPTWGSGVLGSMIAQVSGSRGPVETLSAACASGTIAIGEAANLIREGRCDVVIAGGAEAPFTPTSFAGVCSSKAMSERWDDPTAACRPFDATRDGYVMSEGAGILVLESAEFAEARGATVLAEVIGYAQTDDASHITVPTGEGLRTAIGRAMSEARIAPADLDYINAHGTSTLLNDKWETWAVRQALGKQAEQVPLSSTKSMTGHLLGAAGAIEAIACLIAMQGQFLPPTINHHHPDPECGLDVVPNVMRECAVETVLTQSLGFGGHNAALILRN